MSQERTLEPGFYWVRLKYDPDNWTIARRLADPNDPYWDTLYDRDNYLEDWEIIEVGPRIEPPK